MAREIKDSEVEWIGNIPENWCISKLKYLGRYINGYPFKPSDWSRSGLRIIRIQDLTGSNNNSNYFNGEIEKRYLVSKGDILISWAATLDAFLWNGENAVLNQHIFKAIPSLSSIVPKFFFWLVKESMLHMNHENKHGIFMQHVTADVFNNFQVPLPPLSEQRRIADFLDAKCAKIDEILEKTRASIEEYKKLKQAVITETVTKGVRGTRPMKPSGIEWIGEIPEEWEVEKGKRLFEEVDDRSETGKEELLTVSHITGITPRSQKNVYMFLATSLVGYKKCRRGDIAANTMWMWQGAIGVSEYDGVISPSYNVYRQSRDCYNSDYLDRMLRIPLLVGTYRIYSTGITPSRLRLYPDKFLSIPFLLPPRKEQKEIADYLNRKCADIDALIMSKEKFLDQMEAYRKSLIYEYVTGKKEVAS